jgi:antitoxin component YwqK of YwqJK toxin-antitoxin module
MTNPAAALLLAAVPAGWYRSDALGLALEPLPGARRGEPQLLRVEWDGETEIRTLYSEGKESRRWELSPGMERVYADGVLAEERSYDGAGRLLAEKIFAAGALNESRQYRYGLSGLSSVEIYGPDGALRARERYELGPGGELRRVRRESPGAPGAEELALVTGGGRLYEERLGGGGRSLVSRYDPEGRVASQETWQERELVESLDLAYPASGGPVGPASPPGSTAGRFPLSTERTVAGTRTVTRYDAEGREASRLVSRGGKRLEEWSFGYDAGGNRVLAVRVDEHGIEQWSYRYDAAGNLEREEYRARGQLEKIVRYLEGGRVEELYRAGLPFLVVTYRGGVKVLEEFLEGGQVVRRRQFGAKAGQEAGAKPDTEGGLHPDNEVGEGQ